MNTHKLDEFRVEFDDKQFNACSTTILAKDMEDAKKHYIKRCTKCNTITYILRLVPLCFILS